MLWMGHYKIGGRVREFPIVLEGWYGSDISFYREGADVTR